MHRAPQRLALILLFAALVADLATGWHVAAASESASTQLHRAVSEALADAEEAFLREWRRDHPGETTGGFERVATPMDAEAIASNGAWDLDHPPIKERHVAVYDPVRDRMIVIGGFGVSGSGGGILNDVWAMSMSGAAPWTPIATAGTPPVARYGASAIYDPARDRIVLFGGQPSGGLPRDDVWVLELDTGTPTWIQLAPTGIKPRARAMHSAVYDAAGDRMVVFGGVDSSNGERNDVWTLSFADTLPWRQMLPANTPPLGRRSPVAVFDPAARRMIVFGGYNNINLDLQDVWLLTLGDSTAAWNSPANGALLPPARRGGSGVWDPAGNRLMMFGGANAQGTMRDTWQLKFDTTPPVWSLLAAAAPLQPAKRQGHSLVLDTARQRLVMYGGRDTIGLLPTFSAPFRGDAWTMSLAAPTSWSPLPGLLRNGHAGGYDPFRDRMVVHGGSDGATLLGDVWAVPLDGEPVPIATAGTPPSPRHQHVALFDAVRDRLLVFGGRTGTDQWSQELWALSFAGATPTWTPLAPTGTPPEPREGAAVVHDVANDRLVLFGGYRKNAGADQFFNDVWTLSLATHAWTKLTPTGTAPTVRRHHAMALDALRQRAIVHGGEGSGAAVRSDVFALSLGATPAWTTLAPSGSAPSLQGHSLIYDRPRDRVVAHGGWGGLGASRAYIDKAYALTLAGTPTWSTLAPTGAGVPRPRTEHVGFYDARRDRMMAFGGYGSWSTSLSCYDDVWWLVWGTPTVGVDDPLPRAGVALSAPRPNPARTHCSVAWSLPSRSHARVEVLDLAGRRVRLLLDADLPAGAHDARWDGSDDAGASVTAGLYFLRLTTDAGTSSRRVAWVR